MRYINIKTTCLTGILVAVMSFFCLADTGLAQLADVERQAEEDEEVTFYVDYATFQSGEEKVILEVYLMIPRSEFEFVKPDTLDRYVARGFVQVGLAQNDSIRYLDRWPINDSEESVENVTDSQNIPDISYFDVPPGNYELIVQVIDLHTEQRGLFREPVTLSRFTEEELTISDIEFASMVEMAEKKTIFTKAQRNIVPNASLTYGTGSPILYSYAEVYNLEYPSETDSFEVQYSILDLNNAEVKSPQTVVRNKAGLSGIDIGGLNVVGLPAGIYFYRLRVTDLGSGEVATRSKKFFVYKPGSSNQPMTASASGVDYSTMSEAELEEEFDSMSPLLTGNEKRNFRRAGLEGKQNLMTQFWEKRDPDPSTRINELQIEYSQRLDYVKNHYGNQQTPSYRTDRGRVFLVYGEPDEVERNPVSVNAKPYEIWLYHSVQGGVEFVFVDRSGFGVYELVHSTARNELYDPNWRQYIQATPGSFD